MKAGPSWGWEEGLQALSSGPLATDAAADPCGTLWVGCKVSVRSFQDRVRAGVLAPVWGTIPTASGLHPEAGVVERGGGTIAPHKGNRSIVLTATITTPPKPLLLPKSFCHLVRTPHTHTHTFSFCLRG